MPESTLHLVKVPLLADKLVDVARRRGISLRDLDDGYLAHCVLRELWQERAPSPFVLRGHGRWIDAWGYSKVSSAELVEHARTFGDPTLLSLFGDPDRIASKPMPVLEKGRRIGFHLRACPVVRLSSGRGDVKAGAEIDAYLACLLRAGKDGTGSREEVYREWLLARLGGPEQSGVKVERIAVAAFARERLVRRTHSEQRKAKSLERPDVRFEGEFVVEDPERFLGLLGRGIGRHRSFGFGALMIVQPGSPYPRS